MSWSDDAARNRELWTKSNAEHTGEAARAQWAAEEITWGMWGVPEREVRVLPDLDGKDVVELGCGTAYVSAWLARRGARPVGVDITPAQLETARELQREFGIEFPLLESDAADTGLADASFDLVVSEYGASIWVDPYRWIPEAARLLRPGGELVFLRNSTLVILCSPDGDEPVGERLVRPQLGLHRVEGWGGVEFHLGHGDWVRLLHANGFEILDLHELLARPDATTHEYYDFVTAERAKQWPSEEIWRARKQ
ncbi:MAG: class I SAM-dependent methyltransferase [Gaiellaceae bacterium]